MKVLIAHQAKTGFRDIVLEIARESPARALSFIRHLRAKSIEIGDVPRAFPLIPRYEHRGIRRRTFGNYLIFYRVGEDRVLIMHIQPGAQEFQKLLFPEG